MSFLFPLYVAGCLAVGLPILFHLIRRRPRSRVEFSSLMFLRESPPRITRRSRLENILLLLLRAAILCLIAFAFARPFLRETILAGSSPAPRRMIAVLLDTSASMRRDDLWQQALDELDALLGACGPHDHVSLYAFNRQVQEIAGFAAWQQVPEAGRAAWLRARAAQIAPTWSATNTGAAIAAVADALLNHLGREATPGLAAEPRIVLISDLQHGSDFAPLRDYDWPKELSIERRTVQSRSPSNAGLHVLADDANDTIATAGKPLRLRVSNTANSERARFTLRWSGAEAEAATVYVPPGKSRVISLARPAGDTAGSLVLDGDSYDFDNRCFVAPTGQRPVVVAVIGGGAAGDPRGLRYYIDQAFAEPGSHSVRVLSYDATAMMALDPAEVALVVVAGSLDGDSSLKIEQYVASGGTVLVAPTTADLARKLIDHLHIPGVEAAEGELSDYVMLSEIDFAHPLFRPFADSRYGDFTKIYFWKYRQLTLDRSSDARVIVRFDNRAPALIERRSGTGSLFFLASTWEPGDSQLAVSSKFVPLVYGMAELTGATRTATVQYAVGDTVSVPPAGTGYRVRMPGGTLAELEAGSMRFDGTDEPGIYEAARVPSDGSAPIRFAVNLDPRESDTAVLPSELLEQFGLRLTAETNSRKIDAMESRDRQMRAIELEGRQKLWRWLVAAALVLASVESWLAGRLSFLVRHDGAPATHTAQPS